MKRKLTAIVEQKLAQLGMMNCRVVEIVFSQECPPVAKILISCEGKKHLPIFIENAAFKEDLDDFILQELQDYLGAN
jgi:hypothetical protein